ncbi:MAG: hypothetical protein Kow00106_09590 [Anaerolineae bacterium]
MPESQQGGSQTPAGNPTTITFLATAHIAGELNLLPRLFTLIRQERQKAAGPVVLLDLGDTCAAEAWICRATWGRAPFLVLDSMGYDAAIIGGPEATPIPPVSLRLLVDQILMSIIVWNRPRTLSKGGITFTVAPGTPNVPPAPPVLVVDRAAPMPPEAGAPPIVGDVPQGCLARVEVAWPQWTVRDAYLLTVDTVTSPDPTIAAVVGLVEHEARQFAQQQGDDHEPE